MKTPTKHQAAVLRCVAAENVAGRSPVSRDVVMAANGVVDRHLTATVAACVDAGWLVVPVRGVSAYNITNEGMRALDEATREHDYTTWMWETP